MNAPGKGLLKVTSLLFIVFGAIATLISIFGLACSGFLTNMATGITGSAAAGTVGGILVAASILLLASSLLELILGVMGLKRCDNPEKANFFIVWGIILCVLTLVSMIMSFSFWSLVGFVLPILYVVGGFMNKGARSHAP